MNVRHTLICFFFLSGNTGLINAEIPVITGKEGGNITYGCKFILGGRWKGLYKEKKLLIETKENKAQSDRYSIEYKPGIIKPVLYVNITNLTKSDSGKYRCVLDIQLRDEEFELRVEDAPSTLKPTWTPGPFPTSVPSTSTPTPTHSLISSSGSSTPSPVSPNTTHQSQQQQTAAGPDPSTSTQTEDTPQALDITSDITSDQTPTGTLLFVCVILATVFLVSCTAVLLYCRKMGSKPKGTPQGPEGVSVTEADPVYEEIREEDRQSRAPPVEISTVYTYGIDNYSFVTAAQKEGSATNPDLGVATIYEKLRENAQKLWDRSEVSHIDETEDDWRKGGSRKDQGVRQLVARFSGGGGSGGVREAGVGGRGNV